MMLSNYAFNLAMLSSALWRLAMGKPTEPTVRVLVETYVERGSGLHGEVHVRPVGGQGYPDDARVRCSKAMRIAHPIGTKFLIYAKATDREGGRDFLSSHHSWDYEIVELPA